MLIPNGEKFHYLVVKKLLVLLREITSKHCCDFYCLNCLHSLRTKNKLESHKKLCQNKDFCNVIMLSEDTKVLEFNQYQKSDKAPFIICADLECAIEKIDRYKNNPGNSSTTKASEHIPSDFSVYTISSFKSIENRGKDCMKKFCGFLREHTMKIINFKKNKVKSLMKEQQESYKNAKICYL